MRELLEPLLIGGRCSSPAQVEPAQAPVLPEIVADPDAVIGKDPEVSVWVFIAYSGQLERSRALYSGLATCMPSQLQTSLTT